MDKKFDPEKIALAIVASSSYQLSVSEKIQLYMDAYDEALRAKKEGKATRYVVVDPMKDIQEDI